MKSLDSQVAFVTGAGSGIGAAIACELARRGAAVAVTDIDDDAAKKVAHGIESEGGVAWSARCDVTDPDAVNDAALAASSAIGELTTWVSNAGVSTMYPFEELPLAEWQATMDVNATGVFICGQVAARTLARPGGSIINIASMAAKQGRVPFLSHYVASKFAVVGLTQAMAFELGPAGIRVNAVCPGFVATEMQARELEWEAELRNMTVDDVRGAMIDETPLGRIQRPEDVATAVAFLASDDSVFVTGEALAVNGGAFMD